MFSFLIKLTSLLFKKKFLKIQKIIVQGGTSLCIDLRKLSAITAYGVASFGKQGTCDVKVIQSTTAVMTILHTGCAIFLQPRRVFSKADERPGSNFVY